MKTMSCFFLAAWLSFESITFAQNVPSNPPNISNPFDENPMGGGMGGMGGMYEGSGDMGMGMDGGMGGMDMGMGGYGMEEAPTSDYVFRFRLKNAIKRIGAAKSEQEKATLMQYTEKGLEDHYDEMIVRRRKDLARLKKSLAQLETDLTRREAAKERVVKLQLQSAILASEGLLDLKSLQPESAGGGDMMGGGMGMSSGMGAGN